MKWPITPGNYDVGDEKSPVAVLTLLDDFYFDKKKVAIYGRVMTENLGITRILSNILSNPNIRYLIICGREIKGHFPGNALISFYEQGYFINEHGSIVIKGAKSADPKLAIKEDSIERVVERFREQITLIDMRGERDISAINKTIENCLEQNPGPLAEPYEVQIRTPHNSRVEVEEKVAIFSQIKLNDFFVIRR